MNTTVFAALLFTLALAGAMVEGLWRGIPAFLVQVNGLLLLLSALFLATLGARSLLARPRRKRAPTRS